MLSAGAICHPLRFPRCAPRVAQQLVEVRAADASARAGWRPDPVRGPRDPVLDRLLHHAAALQAARRAAPRETPRRRMALHAAHSRDAQAHDFDADSDSGGGWWRAHLETCRWAHRWARQGTARSGQSADLRGAGGRTLVKNVSVNSTRRALRLIAPALVLARRTFAFFLHHDTITGTSKESVVENLAIKFSSVL